ncbi:uncharacterized protein TM35_000511190 [Trypanosoma theileri]|uniref:Uncharacterized protein n=1 Tax=Trypanosoma theileri TaxID=67003 RepID=A0A1X0NHL9_9TRYP|nr:uncharacterized protein TM35_000511190 [Trypanosoma theileri]ORC84018.1 hypothetical protein TM35_000511190 [Trypanosoma theileri]
MSQKAEITKQDGAEGEHEVRVSSSGTSVSLKTEESGPSAEATSSTTLGTHSSEVVDSQHITSQTPSENATENSNTNDGNPSQNHSPTETSTLTTPNPTRQSAAAPGTSGTGGSEENGNADSMATTKTNSEAPITPSPQANAEISRTPTEAPTTNITIPSLVPNAEINTIVPTLQKKTNADSSVSSVWMRTAAPLLIVVVLFSVVVY